MPAASTERPRGVTLKKLNDGSPRSLRRLTTIMLGRDEISVIMPPIVAATASGMSMRLRFKLVQPVIVRTTGMNIAVTAVELINAVSPLRAA